MGSVFINYLFLLFPGVLCLFVVSADFGRYVLCGYAHNPPDKFSNKHQIYVNKTNTIIKHHLSIIFVSLIDIKTKNFNSMFLNIFKSHQKLGTPKNRKVYQPQPPQKATSIQLSFSDFIPLSKPHRKKCLAKKSQSRDIYGTFYQTMTCIIYTYPPPYSFSLSPLLLKRIKLFQGGFIQINMYTACFSCTSYIFSLKMIGTNIYI